MKICVLKCDNAPDKTIEKFGDYDKIYNTFLNIDNETKTITFVLLNLNNDKYRT